MSKLVDNELRALSPFMKWVLVSLAALAVCIGMELGVLLYVLHIFSECDYSGELKIGRYILTCKEL